MGNAGAHSAILYGVLRKDCVVEMEGCIASLSQSSRKQAIF